MRRAAGVPHHLDQARTAVVIQRGKMSWSGGGGGMLLRSGAECRNACLHGDAQRPTAGHPAPANQIIANSFAQETHKMKTCCPPMPACLRSSERGNGPARTRGSNWIACFGAVCAQRSPSIQRGAHLTGPSTADDRTGAAPAWRLAVLCMVPALVLRRIFSR